LKFELGKGEGGRGMPSGREKKNQGKNKVEGTE
jgi:hypothetical protein